MKDLISFYPCQMEIAYTEKCNQVCDYCWVNKSSAKILDFKSIQRAIDIFLDFPLERQTITFTTSEPLIYPDLYQKVVDYVLSKDSGKRITMITTTNGMLLTGRVRDFILERLNDRFILNISLDGKQKSYDAHRRIKGVPERSAFQDSWKNFAELPRDKARVIFTITPSEINCFRDNMNFILEEGFRKIDLFAQMFTFWPVLALRKLKEGLSRLIKYLDQNSGFGYDIRLLNRLWGSSDYAKMLLASDGRFYLFEWVLALPVSMRARYAIGGPKGGVDLAKRAALFDNLLSESGNKHRNLCAKCGHGGVCSWPLPIFLWSKYKKKNHFRYLRNFCLLAGIFIEASSRIKHSFNNELDALRLSRGVNRKPRW